MSLTALCRQNIPRRPKKNLSFAKKRSGRKPQADREHICWAVHSAVGCAVTAKKCGADRVPTSVFVLDDFGMRKLPHTAAEDLPEIVTRQEGSGSAQCRARRVGSCIIRFRMTITFSLAFGSVELADRVCTHLCSAMLHAVALVFPGAHCSLHHHVGTLR
jgi:hypothetical protein